MIRVLVFGITANPGGVENFLMNYYRHIDRSVLQFDFLCNFPERAAYEEELIDLGGRIYRITARSQNRQLFQEELEQLFREHGNEWKAVWVNVCSLANIDYLKIANKYQISRRIIHSHNTRNMDGLLRGMLHHINRYTIQKYATDFWACSEEAARWFYRPHLVQKAEIIHNAIDTDKLRFSQCKRDQLRERFDWKNKYIIGNIGRLHFQKNQSFILDVFSNYSTDHADAMLVFVGQGEDEQSLKEKVRKLNLQDKVVFVGLQQDIQGFLSCFDLFLFPSRFEGLSIAGLEAQANGIPVLASEQAIPGDVILNHNVVRFSLEKNTIAWSQMIETMRFQKREDYESIRIAFENIGYEIRREAALLEAKLTE